MLALLWIFLYFQKVVMILFYHVPWPQKKNIFLMLQMWVILSLKIHQGPIFPLKSTKIDFRKYVKCKIQHVGKFNTGEYFARVEKI